MPKSPYAEAVDELQRELRPFFKQRGFKTKGRGYNRGTSDGLTQVIAIQMGASDPPGTTYIPGLRENLHGLFTVNLGVYVPEVARHHGGGEAKSWIQEYHCCVRSRLGDLGPENSDLWWPAVSNRAILDELRERVDRDALPFLDRFESRDRIMAEWRGLNENLGASSPPRIVLAIMFVQRGQAEQARALLKLQAQETQNPGHSAYVRQLAERLGLGSLDA